MPSTAFLTITIYFLLNLVVTITNKQLVSNTSCPYLLTASHAFCTFITTSILAPLQNRSCRNRDQNQAPQYVDNGKPVPPSTSSTIPHFTVRAHVTIILFSLLYTINIAVSNLTLGLISLSLHQTIRATTPAITVLLSVTLLGKPLSAYSRDTYLSLIPTICGVVLATSPSTSITSDNSGNQTALSGILLTFLGAVLAVVKTILTHTLQTATGRFSLNLPSATLIRYLAPYAVVQALLLGGANGEFRRFAETLKSSTGNTGSGGNKGVLSVGFMNALGAAMLNVASFEANRRCGPLAMAVAANLKQAVILVVAGGGRRVVIGATMTVAGGMWYAFAQKWEREWKQNGTIKEKASPSEAERPERQKGMTEKGEGSLV